MAKLKKELPMPKIKSKEMHFFLGVIAAILMPIVRSFFKVVPEGIEKLPKKGPYVLVINHVTNLDALAVAYFVYAQLKRAPHFLGKESLFRVPVIGSILRAAGQIPVYRSGHRNETPLKAAHAFLKAGHTIAIFPEGTLTRDPDLWPMRGRSGAIRLALETGVPVFPIGQWGSEQVLPQYGRKFRPGFWKPVRILVGDEVQLNNYRKRQLNPDELSEATALVMFSITDLVAQLRGLPAPKSLWDPAQAGQATTGNFKKVKSKS